MVPLLGRSLSNEPPLGHAWQRAHCHSSHMSLSCHQHSLHSSLVFRKCPRCGAFCWVGRCSLLFFAALSKMSFGKRNVRCCYGQDHPHASKARPWQEGGSPPLWTRGGTLRWQRNIGRKGNTDICRHTIWQSPDKTVFGRSTAAHLSALVRRPVTLDVSHVDATVRLCCTSHCKVCSNNTAELTAFGEALLTKSGCVVILCDVQGPLGVVEGRGTRNMSNALLQHSSLMPSSQRPFCGFATKRQDPKTGALGSGVCLGLLGFMLSSCRHWRSWN